ncbi:MAG: triose-phosphate isomerase [Dehalococcoidia bacterium]|nr:triose-phosphate isomerase [Dehalococcoidia bacterium]
MPDGRRLPIVGGNWKMHTDRAEAHRLLDALVDDLDGLEGVEVVVCPPAPWLGDAADAFDDTSLAVGAQDVYWVAQGAFTGAVAASQLVGTVEYVLAGHSERRQVFGETDEHVNLKLRAVLGAGLRPILAVGERHEEREAGRTIEVLERQLRAAFEGIPQIDDGFVIAYEPVWAIGTGLAATPEMAQEACAAVRAVVADRFGADVATTCRVQYGGSVNPANVEGFARQPDIDGALVGGAALHPDAFAAICRAVAAAF